MTIERVNPETGVIEDSETIFGIPTGWGPKHK